MTHVAIATTLVVSALALGTATAPAEAGPHHRRHVRLHTIVPPVYASAPEQPFMFYPQDVDGGVPGNLPFNNQIRKHSDPLNANGGR